MKIYTKITSFLLIAALLVLSLPFLASAKDTLSVSARSACLIEAESGRLLYSKNASRQMPMASTTKIMTAIVAIESGLALDTLIKAPREAVGVEGSSMYLAQDERVTLEVLLYALLLASANDAAVAIAIAVGGSLENFVSMMNKKAASLGLSDTSFQNPHGLNDEGHFTTAHDLARLMAYAIKNPTFLKISGCKKIAVPKENDGVRVFINHNRLLGDYDGVIAGKTGFTKKSGRCLVTAAERNGLTLIAVTLSAPNDWADHTSLYDFAFDSYERVQLEPITLNIPVISGKKDTISASSQSISWLLSRSHGEITVKTEAPRFIFAPVKSGDVVGRVKYICDGRVIGTSPIIAEEDAERIKFSFSLIEWIKSLFKGHKNG